MTNRKSNNDEAFNLQDIEKFTKNRDVYSVVKKSAENVPDAFITVNKNTKEEGIGELRKSNICLGLSKDTIYTSKNNDFKDAMKDAKEITNHDISDYPGSKISKLAEIKQFNESVKNNGKKFEPTESQKQAEKKDTIGSRRGTLIYAALVFLGLVTVLLITFSWLV